MRRIKILDEGFTIVELIVVIAIIAVVAAVAIPGLILQLPKIRVNGAVRNLASDMQWAKLMAVKENNDFIMVFNSVNNSYTIYDDNDNDGNFASTDAVKTVNLSDISKGIIFGGVNTGVRETDCGGNITDPVTFSADNFTFQANALSNKLGAVYLIPSIDDNATTTNPRLRAITVSQTGRVKAWKLESKTPCSWSQQ